MKRSVEKSPAVVRINRAIEEAKKLIAQNKKDEADTLLKKTINTLELIAETDRFNKSE